MSASNAGTVDYADAMRLQSQAAQSFKQYAAGEDAVVVKCSEAVREALRTGYLFTGTKQSEKPEGAVTSAEYAAAFGLANGSLVTLWRTGAMALDRGIAPDSVEWHHLMAGRNPIGRKGGVADAVRTARSATGIKRAVKALGHDLTTGEVGPGKARGARPEGNDKAEDATPLELATTAAKVLQQVVSKLSDEDYATVRSHVLDTFARHDRTRAPKGVASPATVAKAVAAK
jgi:hypothetical protein